MLLDMIGNGRIELVIINYYILQIVRRVILEYGKKWYKSRFILSSISFKIFYIRIETHRLI